MAQRFSPIKLDPLLVSAGNKHVKHALQASDNKANPATHQAQRRGGGAHGGEKHGPQRSLSTYVPKT